MKLLIPSAYGLEAVVKRQLERIGYPDTRSVNGRVELEGDWSDVARLNLFLRSGERVLIQLSSFKAETFDELFDGVRSINWEDYLSPHARILMDGKSVKSKLGAIKATGGVAKKAIISRMIDKKRLKSKFLDESGERYKVGISLLEDECSVTIDTSGEGLHKRGYRSKAYTAPLKETTAAGLIDLSYYFPDKQFADVFCGSGTLPIEAALKTRNIAPGINRDFDFENWRCAQKGVMAAAKEEALDVMERGRTPRIYASDISENAISIAKYHAARAGVEKDIEFHVADMRAFSSEERYGVMISNPPYGERLSDAEEVKVLYRDLGKTFRALPDWNGYFLTGFPDFERWFGKSAPKKRKLYNANIECCFYSYPSRNYDKE